MRFTTTIMDDPRAPPEKVHPGTTSAASALNPSSTGGNHANGPLPLRGHELPFVAPSSYLRPKPNSRTMPDRTSPLDRDQMQGLVSKYSETLPRPARHELPSSPLLSHPDRCCVAMVESLRAGGCDAGFRDLLACRMHTCSKVGFKELTFEQTEGCPRVP